MTDRIIDLSEEPCRLHVRNELLVIQRNNGPEFTLPLAELGVLVVSHPQVSYSHAVLAGVAAAGGAFVACDARHMPVAMLLPLDAHHVQTERLVAQAQAKLPTNKRIWRQLVRAKIRAQAGLLQELRGHDAGLHNLVSRVRSGDPQNMEAQASRRYWKHLFADGGFRRDREADDQNRHLNYGYAILRAVVARAICAAGLHPSLGLHHHNRYNSFCLADDLMEPFRPNVDGAVVRWVEAAGNDTPLDREAKTALIEAIAARLVFQGESRTLFDVVGRIASSLVAVYAGERKELLLPEF